MKKCAACGAEFNPADSPSFKRHFPCVHCGVELEYVMQHKVIVSVLSLAVALGLPLILGMGGLTYLLSAILITPLAWLLTMLIADQIDPPPPQKYGA